MMAIDICNILKDKYALGIIKPDAMNKKEEIITFIKDNQFDIVGFKQIQLTQEILNAFYYDHKDRGFFQELCEFMMESEVFIMIIRHRSHSNTVDKFRDFIGSTNPIEAKENTIRKKFGIDIMRNTIHGSDSIANGLNEISLFFALKDLIENDNISLI